MQDATIDSLAFAGLSLMLAGSALMLDCFRTHFHGGHRMTPFALFLPILALAVLGWWPKRDRSCLPLWTRLYGGFRMRRAFRGLDKRWGARERRGRAVVSGGPWFTNPS